MAEMKKIFCGDFVDMVRKLEEASDGRGNKLYDRSEIAELMGFTNANLFERKLKEARTMYRKNLQKKVRKMKEEGLSVDQISERTMMSTNTIDILLDTNFDDNADFVNSVREEQKKADEEFRDSMNKNIEEMNKILGTDSLFGGIGGRW